jgi:hypothetical protein
MDSRRETRARFLATPSRGHEFEAKDGTEWSWSGRCLRVIVGSHLVRAYGITTAGPPPPFVEKVVEVSSGQTSRLEFFDCTMCVEAGPR